MKRQNLYLIIRRFMVGLKLLTIDLLSVGPAKENEDY